MDNSQLRDPVDRAYIENSLRESVPGIRVIHKEETGSTNEDALAMLSEGEGPVLVIADAQLKGRGRRGRDFFSPEGTGLYMSLAMPYEDGFIKDVKVTATAAVAVALAIDEAVFSGTSTSLIKWVNDIYLKERKVCGILTEARLPSGEGAGGSVVVGIGINVYEPDGGFPEGIAGKAGYIIPAGRADKIPGLRSKLAVLTFRNLFYYLKRQDESIRIYREKSSLTGARVLVNSFAGDDIPQKTAYVLGIDDDCSLLVKYEDGTTEALSSGEVSVVKE